MTIYCLAHTLEGAGKSKFDIVSLHSGKEDALDAAKKLFEIGCKDHQDDISHSAYSPDDLTYSLTTKKKFIHETWSVVTKDLDAPIQLDGNSSHPIYLAGSDYQTSNSINLTGCWFVNFGADLPNGSIEGSRILTLKGDFDPDTLMDVLVENIYNDLPENARKLLNKHKLRIVIRAFNRI